jgi:hypothetical protein
MLGRNRRERETDGESSTRQPLLNDSQEDLREHGDNDLLFNVDDDDEEGFEEASAIDQVETPKTKAGRNVHFQEEVQVYAAPLRSTTASREAGE